MVTTSSSLWEEGSLFPRTTVENREFGATVDRGILIYNIEGANTPQIAQFETWTLKKHEKTTKNTIDATR